MRWQPAARGHRAYTDLSMTRSGAGTMHSLQPCQQGNDSLLNKIHISLFGQCLEGPSHVNHSELQEGFLGSAGCRCFRIGHNRSNFLLTLLCSRYTETATCLDACRECFGASRRPPSSRQGLRAVHSEIILYAMSLSAETYGYVHGPLRLSRCAWPAPFRTCGL